ncbi:MAG: hypothetical protein AABN95_25220 [Acidobacteriota bacterium]
MLKLSLLEKYKEYGVIFIRLIVGFHLVYGTQDNVFSYARMEEFASFLSALRAETRGAILLTPWLQSSDKSKRVAP